MKKSLFQLVHPKSLNDWFIQSLSIVWITVRYSIHYIIRWKNSGLKIGWTVASEVVFARRQKREAKTCWGRESPEYRWQRMSWRLDELGSLKRSLGPPQLDWATITRLRLFGRTPFQNPGSGQAEKAMNKLNSGSENEKVKVDLRNFDTGMVNFNREQAISRSENAIDNDSYSIFYFIFYIFLFICIHVHNSYPSAWERLKSTRIMINHQSFETIQLTETFIITK